MPDLSLTPGVLLDQVHITGDLSGANGTDARLGAVALYGAHWRRGRVIRSKIEFLNARGARLREVIFEDCQLVEPDFAAAAMKTSPSRGAGSCHRSSARQSSTGWTSRARISFRRKAFRHCGVPRYPGSSSSTSRRRSRRS